MNNLPAYFIGGPYDLSKHMLTEEKVYIKFLGHKSTVRHSNVFNNNENTEVIEYVYRLLTKTIANELIYEYVGIQDFKN